MIVCPICGKDVSKAKWLDVKKDELGNYELVAEVVDYDEDSETYNLDNIVLKSAECLLAFEPGEFDTRKLIDLGRDIDDVGAYCMHCGGSL